MNKFESFLKAHPFGFVTDKDLPELISLHRLCQCVVRCGGRRFTCSAQDVAGMVALVEGAGDYVRDVSVSCAEIDRAADWKPEPDFAALNRQADAKLQVGVKIVTAAAARPPRRVCGPDFDEAVCGGVFDGFCVTSDADPGL